MAHHLVNSLHKGSVSLFKSASAAVNNVNNKIQEGAITTTNTIHSMLVDKAHSGDSDAQVALAKVYVEARDFIQARSWFARIAEKGDIKAISTIASYLYYKDDSDKDYHAAALMYHKAALLGAADAQYQYGMCLLNGDGVEEDAEKATEFFQMAAEQNMSQAQYMLGFCHEMGQGVQRDYQKAFSLYTKAAEQGVRIAAEGAKRIKKIVGEIESDEVIQQRQSRRKLGDLLRKLKLTKYIPIFEREEIDYDLLTYLSDTDLEKLGIPLGPRKKIMIELGTDSQLIMKNFSNMCTELSKLASLVSAHSDLLHNFLESVTKASTQALAKETMMMPTTSVPAQVTKTVVYGDEMFEYRIDEMFDYDMFLSHKQANGADLAQSIKLQLGSLNSKLRIFLDVDDLGEVHKLEELVTRSKNFVLLITDGVFDRPFVQLECRIAMQLQKNIILVHDERNCKFPSPDSIPEDLRAILSPLAIPYYRPKVFRDASIKMLYEKLK